MKPISKKLLVVGVLALAAVAWAASAPSKDLFRWVTGRLNVGSTYVEGNGLTFIGKGCTTNDFTAIGAGVANCQDSVRGATLTGARMGDTCSPSWNLGMDGGAGLSIEAQVDCHVSANGLITFRACSARADAGALDLPDAGWCGTIFSTY